MQLVDLKVTEFNEVLASNEPAPGGGSVSALAASMGVALTHMVAELTKGKKKYVDSQELAEEIANEAKPLQAELLAAVDKDTEAFNAVSAVFSMPKDTDEQKAARKEAMQEALKGAAKSPLHMMELIHKALVLAERGLGHLNQSANSDLGVAALNLKSGLRGAWLNVLINLSGINDEAFVNDMKKQGRALLLEGEGLADKIYENILESL